MSSNNVDRNNTEDKIVLRDLQTMLRRSLNEQLTVVDFTTSILLPKGENYGSTMLKVEAVIKREKTSQEENLSLVAKMIPDFQKTRFNCTNSFMKEIYVFEKLIPAYQQLEKEIGMQDKDLFDILPKFYGGRLTMNEKIMDKADEDAVLLMENLKVRQYTTMDRMHGLDLDHAKVAIATLARFHALGRAVKIKKPALFTEAEKPLSRVPFDVTDNEISEVAVHTFETLCTDPRIAKYKDRIEVLKYQGWQSIKPCHPLEEPWISIIHGDFWVNNIMYQQENGRINDIKFVDFQLVKVSNPLTDLPYFIGGSINPDVIDEHIDELLDIYFNKFIEVLDYTGCDTSPYTRKSFDENLKKQAYSEFFHCVIGIKFFTMKLNQNDDLNDLKSQVMMSDVNNLFIERSWRLILMYIKKGWI